MGYSIISYFSLVFLSISVACSCPALQRFTRDEDKKKLIYEDSIIFDTKTFEIGPKALESVKSVLDYTFENPEKIKKTNEESETEVSNRYNLRPRK